MSYQIQIPSVEYDRLRKVDSEYSRLTKRTEAELNSIRKAARVRGEMEAEKILTSAKTKNTAVINKVAVNKVLKICEGIERERQCISWPSWDRIVELKREAMEEIGKHLMVTINDDDEVLNEFNEQIENTAGEVSNLRRKNEAMEVELKNARKVLNRYFFLGAITVLAGNLLSYYFYS